MEERGGHVLHVEGESDCAGLRSHLSVLVRAVVKEGDVEDGRGARGDHAGCEEVSEERVGQRGLRTVVLEPERRSEGLKQSATSCGTSERGTHPSPIAKSDRLPPRRQRTRPVTASM